MPHRSTKMILPMLAALLLLAGACGPTRSDRPAPVLSIAPRDFATGIQALHLARQRVPGASQVLRMTVTFPRDGGRAEFWSIELVDPARAAQPYRVDIEAKRVVAVQDATMTPEVIPAAFDQIVVDSSDAVDVVQTLDWIGADHEVVLQSTSWLVGGSQAPASVRGIPTWRFQVVKPSQQGSELSGFVWVSSQSGSVVAACRLEQGPC